MDKCQGFLEMFHLVHRAKAFKVAKGLNHLVG